MVMKKSIAKKLVCQYACEKLKKEFKDGLPKRLILDLEDPDIDEENWIRMEESMRELISELDRRSRLQKRT